MELIPRTCPPKQAETLLAVYFPSQGLPEGATQTGKAQTLVKLSHRCHGSMHV